MKIIATQSGGRYIAEISQTEIEKCLNKYYGGMGRLVEGSELNLGEGFDFRRDIQEACKTMIQGRETFDRKWESLMSFAKMIAALPQQDATTEAPHAEEKNG